MEQSWLIASGGDAFVEGHGVIWLLLLHFSGQEDGVIAYPAPISIHTQSSHASAP